MQIADEKVLKLEKQAKAIRETIIKMLVAAGSGHTAGSLGMADIFTAFYFHILNHDPQRPNWEDRDRLILSNGHICPVLYAAMAHSGYFPVEECLTLRKFGSRLQGHPERLCLPGIETTSGPLGEGLSQAAGMAYAFRMDKMWDIGSPTTDVGLPMSYMGGRRRRVYCVMSDGEQEEGSTWEAVMFAGKNRLAGLTAIMDRNNIQIDGETEDVMPIEPIADKYRAFNWNVLEVDGHDISKFIQAIDKVKTANPPVGGPTLIIAHTIPGKGVPEIENDFHWHGKSPTAEEGDRFIKYLNI
ncbi:MAG: transketolase [bacterium]